MAQEHWINGKHDDASHVGRHSNVKAEQEAQEALKDFFFDMYGIPMSWAITAGGMDNPLGQHWRNVISEFTELISTPVQDGEVDIT